MTDDDIPRPSVENNIARFPLLAYLCGLMEGFASTADPKPGVRTKSKGPQSATWATNNVDVGAWAAWTLAGLHLFSGNDLPNIRTFTTVSRRVLLLAATERFKGNITRMATALGTSRRSLRQQLKVAGLYVERSSSDDPPTEDEPPMESEPPPDDQPPPERKW